MKLKLSNVQVLELYDAISPKVPMGSAAKLNHPLGEIHNKLRQYIVSALDNASQSQDIDEKKLQPDPFPLWCKQQNDLIRSRQEVTKIVDATDVTRKTTSQLLSEILHDDEDEVQRVVPTYPRKKPPPPLAKFPKKTRR